MSIKELFSKREEDKPKDLKDGDMHITKEKITPEYAQSVIQSMTELKKQGRLAGKIEDYIENPEFLELLEEYTVKAAVRIFDAEQKAKNAAEEEKNKVIEDIYKRRALPKSIKNTRPVISETDFSKMSSSEFERYKRQLEAVTKR